MRNIVVAYSENRVIGRDNQLPWHLPEDLKHFKQTTLHHTIIMGRKTWESLPIKPLPNRINAIVSNTLPVSTTPNVHIFQSLQEAIACLLLEYPNNELFIIGGATLYRTALNAGLVDKIIATEVKGIYEGDAFFPELTGNWKETLIQSTDKFDIKHYERQ